MFSKLLIPALLATGTLASPVALRRDDGSADVVTIMEVVTDIVYVSDSVPVSTCSDEPASTISSTSTQATPLITSAPYLSPNSSSSSSLGLFPTTGPNLSACPGALTVDTSGQPVLIGAFNLVLTGCTWTSTVTQNPFTLISDSSLISATISATRTAETTTAAAGAGEGSTAILPAFSVTTSAAATSVAPASAGQNGGEEPSSTIVALFTTPSAFASQATTLTKVTAAPTFGAELTALSVLETASGALPAAQETSNVEGVTTAKAFAGAAYSGVVKF